MSIEAGRTARPRSPMVTAMVRASELQAQVLDRIWQTREPTAVPEYRKALAHYNRRQGKRKEVQMKVSDGFFTLQRRGFYYIDAKGEAKQVVRPEEPKRLAYMYWPYDRSGFIIHARNAGFLSDARFNRDIRPQRVEEYCQAMQAGEWHDLFSDPITVTDEGQIVNGQHRLAAASQVDWSEAPSDPLFLVVWGVAPEEALHADLARRTDRDQAMIATKLVGRDEV